ncbi:hypothetical protein HZ989_09355 [Brevundimonas sp. AJA228-03]|uniref:hypothetical protein n=1 Tax=Brevundimonas sp. AJA228-03 TaxID=2752515 RepID=UPI001AE08DDA|nr:hypothetical protein [Brevundimonas sp. AJA228-03]QTN18150.1 hypothetical protein HZ989_09355 [Brevundimonas sp. AJA228-03]
MLKAILATAALVAAATAASAQTAPATPPADQAADAALATLPPLDATLKDIAALPTINHSIKALLANPATAFVLEKHLPGVSQHPDRPLFEGMNLQEVADLSGGAVVTQAIIAAIDADLNDLRGLWSEIIR